MILPIVIAGGTGSRLWPLSRSQYPKQFLSLLDENSLLQNTISRLKDIDHASPVVICNEEHRFIVAEQLRQLNIQNASIILEPCAKNTAPAIALAALLGLELYPEHDTILLVLAADHFIADIECFEKCVKNAYHYAKQNDLAIFGVVPTEANTGYGYIQLGDEIKKNDVYKLKQFVEKPDRSTAESTYPRVNICGIVVCLCLDLLSFLKSLKNIKVKFIKFVS